MRSQNSDSAIAVGGAGDASEGGKSLGRVLEWVQGVDVAIQEIFLDAKNLLERERGYEGLGRQLESVWERTEGCWKI
jgi:hypothetical protein